MADPFVAEIRFVGFNFAPKGWAFCNGQLLPISQNTALFSLLGTYYGGDGKSTFALPDLRGSVPLHPDNNSYSLGQQGGSQTVTLLQSEMPVHNHLVVASTQNANQLAPDPTRALARTQGGFGYQANSSSSLTTMDPQSLSVTGGSLPHNNMQPALVMSFIIAMQGVFPPRG
ncbi:MAG: tail fiber protein [Actinomycetota bacterium]|nr:tail fiber protein [Actinomycetota bacterium]